MDIYQEPLFRDLEKLNFSVNEAKVYITLLRFGSSFAGAIAKEAHLDRSSTYNALNLLLERGIVSTLFENKRTIYVPEDPKKIMDYFHEKEAIAQKIIPTLKAQFNIQKPQSAVKLFVGYKGLKTIFQDILDHCDEKESYSVMGSEGEFSKKMPYYAPIFQKRRELKKIKTKILVREGREVKKNNKFNEYRFLPLDIPSPATINIYDNKVAIMIWEETAQGIVIENENVNKTFQKYFELLWEKAKK